MKSMVFIGFDRFRERRVPLGRQSGGDSPPVNINYIIVVNKHRVISKSKWGVSHRSQYRYLDAEEAGLL